MASTAVAVRQHNGLQVYSTAELMQMGEMFVRSGLGHKDLTPEKAVVLMLTGREMGLGPMESVQSLYSPGQGQVGKFTKVLVAQYRKDGHTYAIKESTDQRCVIEFWLKGATEPYVHTLTMAEADKAGWPGRNRFTWDKMPVLMLRYRALSTGIRAIAPDVERNRLGADEIDGMVAGQYGGDADVWDDPDALATRINELHLRIGRAQDRMEELANISEAVAAQDDDVIDSTAREVKDGPHWTASFSDRETFMAKMNELALTDKDMFAALSKSAGKPIERVGQFGGTLDDALAAMEAYVDGQAAPELEPAQEGLF